MIWMIGLWKEIWRNIGEMLRIGGCVNQKKKEDVM
jgi:hypothetical protein